MLEKNIKWLMIVIGLITCTMIYPAIAPGPGLINTFGTAVEGDLANMIVRGWGLLITITGALLVYGAFHPVHRKLVMVAACCSKTWFVVLNLTLGQAYLDHAMPAVIFDTVAVAIFVVYILTGKPAHS